MKARTEVNFSNHELFVVKNDEILIHHLKHKDYDSMYGIKFINTNGIMSVTGDFGNWIFCREFHPSSNGKTSGDDYWIEKLKNSSTQDGDEFDSDATRKEIAYGISSGLREYGYENNELEVVKSFYKELLEYVDCAGWEYESFAYLNCPGFFDMEYIPYQKKTKVWLSIIMDGFDWVCKLLKEQEMSLVKQIKEHVKGGASTTVTIPIDMIFPFVYEDKDCSIEMSGNGYVDFFVKKSAEKTITNITILKTGDFI